MKCVRKKKSRIIYSKQKINKQDKQTKNIHRHRQQHGGYQRERGEGRMKRVKGVKFMMMEGD